MDTIPVELLAHILRIAAASMQKKYSLNLRLVCRTFDSILKPVLCETLNIDVSRLSRLSYERHPSEDALQTIGYHCKSLYVDLMILRDEEEVELLRSLFFNDQRMNGFCDALHERYCLHDKTFHQDEYSHKLETVLFNCRNVERLRLNLPFPLVGRHDVATWMLAITFRALGQRPEEDSARLKVLVLENVTDTSICQLWRNPVDIKNIMFTMEELKHLVITTRRRDSTVDQFEMYSVYLWDMIRQPDDLDSLCLIGMDTQHFEGDGRVKHTSPDYVSRDEWQLQRFPCPTTPLFTLTRLELRDLDLHADFFDEMAKGFGQTLQELYLNSVALKVSSNNVDVAGNRLAYYPFPTLWVGLPNEEQLPHYQWIASTIRAHFKELRICRAINLGYDFHGSSDSLSACEFFDLKDPCGLDRELGQRFVEVVMGFEQPPCATEKRPFAILPPDGMSEEMFPPLIPRPEKVCADDWSTTSHQMHVRNSTSRWLDSLDGVFPNTNTCTTYELHRITQTACRGMSDVRRRI